MKIDEKFLNTFLLIFFISALIVTLYLFVSWFESDKKATKATPVVIDNTTKLPYLLDDDDFEVGTTGYEFASLYQPCEVVDPEKILPNLPLSYTKRICNPDKGLVCTSNVVLGGSICLVDLGRSCMMKNDCVPGLDCLNRTCQQSKETINKVCVNNSDCKGNLENLNHVCEETIKRCKYNFYPLDSGCRIKENCLPSDEFNNVICFSETGGAINLNFEYIGNNQFKFQSGREDEDLKTGIRVNIFDNGNLKGNFIISNVSLVSVTEKTSNYNITIEEVPEDRFSQGVTYQVVIGDSKDGICLSEYPLGSRPKRIINSDTYIPCETGNFVNGYCIEESRESTERGDEGQVCNQVLDIPGNYMKCNTNLSCISNRGLQEILDGNRNEENNTGITLGVVENLEIENGGTGYIVGNEYEIRRIPGQGCFIIPDIKDGRIKNISSITGQGGGYVLYGIYKISDGTQYGEGALAQVNEIGGAGGVEKISIYNNNEGIGYDVMFYDIIGFEGSGGKIKVTEVGEDGKLEGYEIISGGKNYEKGGFYLVGDKFTGEGAIVEVTSTSSLIPPLNIGKCVNNIELLSFGDVCQPFESKCKKDFSCLETEDFSFCGFNWDILSENLLLNCPDGFQRSKINRLCVPESGYICLTNCQNSTSSTLRFFNKETKKFENTNLESIEGIEFYPLIPKDLPSDNEEIPLNYYKITTDNSVVINGNTLDINIQLPTDTNFLDLQVNKNRLNLFYHKEYKNYRRRVYSIKVKEGNESETLVNFSISPTFAISPHENLIYYTNGNEENQILDPTKLYRLSFPDGFINNPNTAFTSMYEVKADNTTGENPVDFKEWNNEFENADHYFITYSSVYSFNYNIPKTPEPIEFLLNTLINGDNVKLNKTENSDIIAGDMSLFNNDSFYVITDTGPYLMLTDDISDLNRDPKIRDEVIYPNIYIKLNVPGDITLTLKPIGGIKMFSLDLKDISKGDIYEITNDEYYLNDSGFFEFNYSFGKFTNINKEDINIGNMNNESQYKTLISSPGYSEIISGEIENTKERPVNKNNRNDVLNYFRKNKSVVEYTKNKVKYYCILTEETENMLDVPSPKIPFSSNNNNYSDIKNYQLDKVENLDTSFSSNNTDNILIFSNYKNIINPSRYEIPIGYQSKLRKTDYNKVEYNNVQISYKDVKTPNDTDKNPFLLDNIYGFCNPIKLDDSVQVLNGSNQITITDQDDIDLFFKYTSSEIVIGFNVKDGIPNNPFVIVNIIEYENENKLVLETNSLINFNKEGDVYFYVNNIFPIKVKKERYGPINYYKLQSGANILLSSTQGNETGFTNYNKIITKDASGGSNFSDVVFPSVQYSIYLTQNFFIQTVLLEIINDVFGFLELKHSFLGDDINYVFVVNNIFFTTILIKNEGFTNNYYRNRTEFNFVFIDGRNGSKKSKSIEIKGLDTIPFYPNEDTKNKDESYINIINWPSWITSLNVGELEFYKMIISLVPGNLSSRTLYYCFVKLNNKIKFLSLSSNDLQKDIIEFDYPLPIPSLSDLDINRGEDLYRKFFMTPYDTKLYLMSANKN